MASTVNGVPTAPDAHGIVQGDANVGSKISGDGGNNKLQGNAGNDIFYGGAGNDTFIIKAAGLAQAADTTNSIAANDVIYDFGGAGGWAASNNDFLALSGFGVGSTLSFARYGNNADMSVNQQLQYWTVHNTADGNDYTIFIKSVNGKLLTTQDYAFY